MTPEVSALEARVQELEHRLNQFAYADRYQFQRDIRHSGLKLGFYNQIPIAKRANANQASISGVNITQTSPWGFGSSQNITDVIFLLEEIRLTLIALGLFKGSA